jgi:tRNA modification GTPase
MRGEQAAGREVEADTIAAVATATGGGVGIIRVSGPEAISLLNSCFRPTSGTREARPPSPGRAR